MIQDELIKNIKLILNSADLVYKSQDYTSATILYFKTAFLVLDYILLKKEGKTPKDHTERFRMLQKTHPELYTFLDKYFKVYRDTYSVSIDKQTCDQVKQNVKRIIKEHGIQI